MNTPGRLHPTYEVLMGEWESQLADLEIRIFQALKRAYPEGRTRRELILDVFHVEIPETEDLNNNPMDRKIRKTIAKMFDDLIPIVSSSGSAGYRLDLSEDTIRHMIAEWQRRREQYARKIERGERLILRIRQGQTRIPEGLPAKPKQMSFIQ